MDAPATIAIGPGGSVNAARPAASADDGELDAAARAFEKMMVQRLLGEARKARFGEEPSNARSNYDAMFDEEIAGLISESGALGLADSLRRSLAGTGQLHVQQPSASASPSAATGLPVSTSGTLDHASVHGLNAASLATLRSLVEQGTQADTDTENGTMPQPGAIDDRGAIPLLASLASPDISRRSDAPGSAPIQQRDFLARLQPHAQDTAQRLGTSTEAVLAVAALESGWGRRPITDAAGRDANNLFGIKAHGRPGPSVTHRTTEYIGGQPRSVEADFRRYDTAGASVQDFGDFLIDNPRYAPALERAADPERFLRALQEAGYATDPNYADKAIRVMHRVQAHLAGDES